MNVVDESARGRTAPPGSRLGGAGMRAVGWVLAVAAGSLALRLLLAGDGPVAAGLALLVAVVAAVCPVVVPTRWWRRLRRSRGATT